MSCNLFSIPDNHMQTYINLDFSPLNNKHEKLNIILTKPPRTNKTED